MISVQLMPACGKNTQLPKHKTAGVRQVEKKTIAIFQPQIIPATVRSHQFNGKICFYTLQNVVFKRPNNNKTELFDIDIANKIDEHIKKAQEKLFWGNIHDIHPAVAYAEAIKTGGFNVKEVIAVGGESLALELENGNVLKLSTKLNYPKFNSEVHAPEETRGIISIKGNHYVDGIKVKNVNYVIQKKGDINVDKLDIADFLKEKAEPSGYYLSDDRYGQFAYFEDKNDKKIVRAIDLGCLSKTQERDIFDKIKEAEKPNKCPIDLVLEILKEKIFGKSYNVATHRVKLCEMTLKVNEDVKQGTVLMDALNSILKENGKRLLKMF